MSFSAHKRDALSLAMPLNHRMSHVRSCAMLMGQKYRVHRDVVIERVRELGGVDIRELTSEADARAAIDALVHIKTRGLDAPVQPKPEGRLQPPSR